MTFLPWSEVKVKVIQYFHSQSKKFPFNNTLLFSNGIRSPLAFKPATMIYFVFSFVVLFTQLCYFLYSHLLTGHLKETFRIPQPIHKRPSFAIKPAILWNSLFTPCTLFCGGPDLARFGSGNTPSSTADVRRRVPTRDSSAVGSDSKSSDTNVIHDYIHIQRQKRKQQ